MKSQMYYFIQVDTSTPFSQKNFIKV